MNDPNRRFFSGNTVGQAVAAAASWHGVDPERLAWRQRDARLAAVRNARGVVIEVDPTALLRTELPTVDSKREPARPAPAVSAEPVAAGRREPGPQAASPRPPRGARRAERPEVWRAPGPEAELAAAEAAARLLALAGLDLTASVRRTPERLEIDLDGPDRERLSGLGLEVLDDLEHLLPRALHGLCGHLVRVRVDGAGLRTAREAELIALADSTAARVAASGEAEVIAPLNPAERRTIHLALAAHPGVDSESLGEGHLKPIRIAPLPPGD